MESPKGFHKEVIEAAQRTDEVDFTDGSFERSVSRDPLKKGGSNFRTHVLVKQGEKMLYKPSSGAAIFCFLFFAIGLGMLFFGLRALTSSSAEDLPYVTFLLIGLIFFSVGALMFYFMYKPIVFDKSIGYFFKGYGKYELKRHSKSFHKIELNDIVAIQIIGESIRSSKSNYNSFELNLVLRDGTRTNIIDHGNLKAIISDAQDISSYLNLPIWHAKTGLT